MKSSILLAVALLLFSFAGACAPGGDLLQAGAASPVESSPGAIATPAPVRENIAMQGTANAFERSGFAQLAVDGDLESIWNSNQLAPQWFSIEFDSFYLVDRIELVVTQLPAGPTTHEIWLGGGSDTRVLQDRLIDVHTEDGQTLEITVEPPRRMNEVLIVTLDSPSWVGWREVRVFGWPSADPVDVKGRETESSGADRPAAEPSPPLGTNVATVGSAFASAGEELAGLANDGDPDTYWTAQLPAPQWYSVSFDELYLVDKLELEIAQAQAGPSTHEIWLGNGSSTRTLYRRFDNLHTEDGHTLEIPIVPPRSISEVQILTLDGSSWEGWREVRVYGSRSEDPVGDAELPQFSLDKFAEGLSLPVQVTHAGDGSGRLFVVEQEGRIRIVRNGVVEETPFLDIAGRVGCCGERGLLNVAFPPAYADKQYFYVNYTDRAGDTVISRFSSAANPDLADPESEEVVLVIAQPYHVHNGGRIVFGPTDGYLYVGSGDGGHSTFKDVENRAQDPRTLLGKILRIDVESGSKPYGSPADNPFVQVDGFRDEIWALGLRNPWGFAFDEATGDLYIPDAGHIKHEEVNFQPAGSRGGENYGWDVKEGSRCFESVSCSAQGLISPVVEYDHVYSCAIVGGAVYRGDSFPELDGVFFYGDFCSGRVWGLKRSEAPATGSIYDGWLSTLPVNAKVPVSGVGEDEEGNLYVIGYQDGALYKIVGK
ncbi:MAG: PQQ-dependent sugar dehydrogenase [Caldilineaceae bacterium]|nr:PQQ-dependent sugar dehydrogenase [Caldilineaceae bacterium]